MTNARGCAALVLFLPLGLQAADRQPLSFDNPGWQLEGDDTKIEELDGKTALRMRTGSAIHRDIRFSIGTIEFDMQLTAYRAFAFVRFHMQNDSEFEEFYFRSHKSLLPDAIQYTPVFRGSGQWQLYHGPGTTAAAEFPPSQWIRVRIVISDSMAALFVGASEEPQLVVTDLAHPSHGGYFSFGSFLPQGEPPVIYPTNFANLEVKPGEVPYDFSKAVPGPTDSPGRIKEWRISRSYAPQEGAVLSLPSKILESADWINVPAEPSGLVALSRYRAKPEGVRRAAILAKATLEATTAGAYRFNFGYSDEVSVFLNGTLLFSGDDSYSFNFPRRQGLISIDQGSLYLPLHKGENELILAITDVFGGWGLMGQIESPAGLEIHPVISTRIAAEQKRNFGSMNPQAPPETAQFAFIVGEWNCTIRTMKPDGSGFNERQATWSGRYTLDGWAIQDIWVSAGPNGHKYHGTNIRSFNPTSSKWDNRWVSAPSLQWKYYESEMVGDTMVMTGGAGKSPNGEFIDRNTFFDIAADSWSWRKDRSFDGGETWVEGIATIEAQRAK